MDELGKPGRHQGGRARRDAKSQGHDGIYKMDFWASLSGPSRYAILSKTHILGKAGGGVR